MNKQNYSQSKGNIRNIRHLSSICLHYQKERLLAYIRCQLHSKAGRTQIGKESTHQLKPMFQAAVFPIYKYLGELHSTGKQT